MDRIDEVKKDHPQMIAVLKELASGNNSNKNVMFVANNIGEAIQNSLFLTLNFDTTELIIKKTQVLNRKDFNDIVNVLKKMYGDNALPLVLMLNYTETTKTTNHIVCMFQHHPFIANIISKPKKENVVVEAPVDKEGTTESVGSEMEDGEFEIDYEQMYKEAIEENARLKARLESKQ